MEYKSKTDWQRDDIVTENDLNRIEQGIEEVQVKLEGIEEGANKYVHPEKHPASMIVEDSEHRFVTDEEKENLNSDISDIKNCIGNLSQLNTNTKNNVVEAVNELFTNVNDGKNSIR